MSKFVNQLSDIPSGEHWAIIDEVGVFIPGDERSRTNPGHGYPETIERYLTYQVFTDEAEFLAELERAGEGRSTSKMIRGIHVVGTYTPTLRAVLEEKL